LKELDQRTRRVFPPIGKVTQYEKRKGGDQGGSEVVCWGAWKGSLLFFCGMFVEGKDRKNSGGDLNGKIKKHRPLWEVGAGVRKDGECPKKKKEGAGM